MNKAQIITGLSVFLIEILGVLIFAISKIEIAEDTLNLIVVSTIIISINIAALILLLVGIFSKEQ